MIRTYFLLLVSGGFSQPVEPVKYYAFHNQVCHFSGATDEKHLIRLNSNNTFTFDTRRIHFSSKVEHNMSGTWEQKNDTLFLHISYADLKPFSIDIQYRIKENAAIPVQHYLALSQFPVFLKGLQEQVGPGID